MKSLMVNTGWHVQHFLFLDDANAEAAYKALKDAMSTYDRFGNDKAKTVSVEFDGVGKQTFKLDHLVAAGIEDLSEAQDELFVQSAVRNERLQKKVDVAAPSLRTTTKVREADRNPVG